MIRKSTVSYALDNYINNLITQYNPRELQMIESSDFEEILKKLKEDLKKELELN
jgi:hypothetical protein